MIICSVEILPCVDTVLVIVLGVEYCVVAILFVILR